MQKEKFAYLFEQYYLKEGGSKERAEFFKLLQTGEYDDQLKLLIDNCYEDFQPEKNPFSTALEAQMLLHILSAGSEKKQDDAKRALVRPLWLRMAGIAAALALMTFGVYFFKYRGAGHYPIEYANDIRPGKVGATLTLANGKKISLGATENGEIASEAGISIFKTAEGQVVYHIKAQKAEPGKLNTLSTARGETYRLILPDQSKVWLNAASSLTYSAVLLERGVRRVKLTGEAYFEISRDQAHPFIVESGSQEVEVLGTHFNVNAYQEEKVLRTTLLEGSVKVSDQGSSKILVPGNQSVNDGSTIRVGIVDADLIVAWKDNNFIFNSQRIEDIMRMIERWYNVDVIYNGEPTKERFWGSVSRFDNVSKVLNSLESTGNVHFKINGRKIYVSP